MKNVAYARGEVSQPAHRRALPLVLMLALLGAVLWREQMWSTQFEELRKTCHAKLGAGVVSSSSVDGPSRLRHDSGSSGAKLVGDVEDEGEEEEAEEYQVQDAPEPAPQPPVQVDLQQEVENEDGDATVEEPQAAPLPTPSQTPQPPASPSPAAAAVVVDPALPVVEVPGGSAPRLFSVPPAHIPDDLLSEFTLNGRIPVFEAYSDDQTQPGDPTKAKVVHYAKSEVDHYIGEARAGHGQYYGEVDIRLYNVLRRHPEIIQGKEVVILGSLVCWYESVALAFGASKVWTIEYGPRTTDDERLSIMTPEQYAANPRLFDLAFSISSFEHDGLGRYGDPLSAVGDLRAMAESAAMLRPGGSMLLAVPRGSDGIVFNHHRIYGPIRWPMLINGWREIDADDPAVLQEITTLRDTQMAQPVYLLAPVARFTKYERK